MIKKLLFWWLPVLIWCLIIFYLSSRPTIRTSEVFFWDFLVKKTAHLTEFFILYLLTYRAVNKTVFITQLRRFFIPLVFIVLYAISDEFHQSFIVGREARARDVLIDSTGGLIALWFLKNLLPILPVKLKSWLKI